MSHKPRHGRNHVKLGEGILLVMLLAAIVLTIAILTKTGVG